MSNPTAAASEIEDYVQAHADSSLAPGYIADHGEPTPTDTDVVQIEGHRIRLSHNITEADQSLIRNTVQATMVVPNACYANALRMWEYNHRFAYAEGIAIPTGIGLEAPLPRAWCMLDGEQLIDFTPEDEYHYGVIFNDDSTIREYGLNDKSSGIINDNSDRHAFLRDQGYLGSDTD